MQPMSETVEALRELTLLGDVNTAHALKTMSQAVKRIVPDILGLSLTLTHEQLTFTMTAAGATFRGFPALVEHGDARVDKTRPRLALVAHDGQRDDEDRWQHEARAASSSGVASTLSLPILHNGVVTADVNLYAASKDAFDGHHDELALACGADAAGAVTNTDMDFLSRFEAAKAPERIRAGHVRDQAVGALMSRSDIDPDQAEERLSQAAERAGISEERMARAVLTLFHGTCGPDTD